MGVRVREERQRLVDTLFCNHSHPHATIDLQVPPSCNHSYPHATIDPPSNATCSHTHPHATKDLHVCGSAACA